MAILKGLFVTGSDTEVGKTWVCCSIIQTLRHRVPRVGAYKPVASGGPIDGSSDAHRLWRATGCLESLAMVCPQAFDAPLAPPLAAAKEGRAVDRARLTSGAGDWNGRCDFLVVEGAGGLLSPLTFESTNADLAIELGWPVVIVIADRLGAVNQALMALEVAAARKLAVAALILNQTTKLESNATENFHAKMIQKQLQASQGPCPPIIGLGYGQTQLAADSQALPEWLSNC